MSGDQVQRWTVALGDLFDDGDTVEVDGLRVRLSILPDDCVSVDDFPDVHGVLKWHRGDTRPRGFDGAAEVIDRDAFGGRCWWQPPADVRRTDPHFAALRRSMLDAREFGFSLVTLEQLHGTDAYGRPIVVHAASLGAVEPFLDHDDLVPILVDLFDELTQQQDVAA